MSTKPIKDYLIKHIFIEKDVVTYRSLSRHFGIKVSEAKQELALYHAKAHEESQTCHATYIISGECNIVPVSLAKRKGRALDSSQQSMETDMSMDTDGSLMDLTQTQDEDYESDDDYEADEDYEDVPVIKVTVVNENDLEDAQAKYRRVTSVHVYSLSPSPVIDAELLCSQTKSVREMDASQGPEYAQKIGKISAPNVVVHRTAAQKESEKNKPKLKLKPTVAGPSRVRQAPEKKPASPAPQDVEMKDSTSTVAIPSAKETKPGEKQAPAKPKQTGRLQFQPKQPQAEVKVEDKAAADKRKGFFSAQPAKKPMTVKEEDKGDDKVLEALVSKPKRGLKRKSVVPSDESGSEEETPQPKQSTSKLRSKETAPTNLRVKKGALISDDETEEEAKPKAKVVTKRKQEAAEKARLAEEKEARELMDLDDDVVERVARKPPSKVVSPKRKREDGSPVVMREAPEKVKQELDDVEMEDAATQPKPKKKREKKVVPLGRNGLKKKRVTKSRTVMDAKGYMGTEDYTDWESVDEEEAEEPKVKATTKTRAKGLTAREKPPADDDSAPSTAGNVTSKQEAPVRKAKTEVPKKVTAPKPKPAGNTTVKGKQQFIANFFGAKPAKK